MTHETVEAAIQRGVIIQKIPFGVSGLHTETALPKGKVVDYVVASKNGGKKAAQARRGMRKS